MKVLMSGVAGKMGRAIAAGIIDEADIDLVAAVDIHPEDDINCVIGGEKRGIPVEDSLAQSLQRSRPDVLLDFTNPQAVRKNIDLALKAHTDVLVGTSGFAAEDLVELHRKAQSAGIRIFVAPNFSLGAVLMMQYAADAAKYFPDVEVIELHHDQKLDAPSGTAIKTLEMMAANREKKNQGREGEFEKISGSRGGEYEGMRVHSVRLPGYVGHQQVLFGGTGQVLSICHDVMSRDSYLPGVLLALRAIDQLEDGLTYGLETIL